MQRDYHRTKEEYEEVVRAAARYKKELHHSKEELKGATEVVASCMHSILALENEKKHADLERDRAKADLEKAKAVLQERNRALQVTAREYDALKAEVAGKVAKAREEAIQEYKNNFKDTVDYLYLMRDVVDEYKMAIKKVDPTFDGDHYDSLIFDEPSTPAPEDPVGFEQLDPIGTPGAATKQEAAPPAEQAQEGAPDQPTSYQVSTNLS